MIICKKCGYETNEGSRYCSQCGAILVDGDSVIPEPTGTPVSAPENVVYCGKCGAKLPEACTYCLICGFKAGDAPPSELDEAEPEPEPAPVPPSQNAPPPRRHSRAPVVLCVTICIMLVLSAAAIWLWQALKYLGPAGMTRAKDAVIYVTGNGVLKFKTPAMSESEAIAHGYTSNVDILGPSLAKVGAGGRYIAYLDGYTTYDGVSSGRLYLRDFARKPAIDGSEQPDFLIGENVTSEFFFTDSGSALVFLTASGELYATDFAQIRLLDSDVYEVIAYSDTQIFYSSDTGGRFNLLLCPLGNTGSKITIDVGVISLIDHTPTLDKFVYLRENSGGGRDIMVCDIRQADRRALALGVSEVIAADAQTFTAMYTTESTNSLRYDNLVEDSLSDSDEKIMEPDLEKYPRLMEFYEKHGLDSDYDENADDYSEELVEDMENFQTEIEKYEERLSRDEFRAQTREDIDNFVRLHPTLYDLHLSVDGVTTRLAGGSYSSFEDAALDMDNGFAVWSVRSLWNIERIPITQHQQAFGELTALDHLSQSLSDDICFQQFGYQTAPLYIGDRLFTSGGWKLTGNGDGIYFAMSGGPGREYPENSFSLYYTPIQNGLPGRIVLIDENISGLGPMLQNNKLLYYKDSFDNLSGLYMTSGASVDRLGDDISLLGEYFHVENGGDTLLYYDHFNSSAKSGNLFMLTKQNRQLATDVCRAFYRNDSLVYFLRGLKDGKAELYSFSGEGLVRVDGDVVAVME